MGNFSRYMLYWQGLEYAHCILYYKVKPLLPAPRDVLDMTLNCTWKSVECEVHFYCLYSQAHPDLDW